MYIHVYTCNIHIRTHLYIYTHMHTPHKHTHTDTYIHTQHTNTLIYTILPSFCLRCIMIKSCSLVAYSS